jgi:hypothetical protein
LVKETNRITEFREHDDKRIRDLKVDDEAE